MRFPLLTLGTLAVISACYFAASAETRQQPGQPPSQEQMAKEMAEMMAKAKKFTQPGEHHEALKRFLGKWDMETQVFAAGQAMPGSKGSMECSWLMDGRWLKIEGNGALMGMPYEMFMIVGYDNFKQSYVTTSIQSIDTAMTHSEGDIDPSGKALITYGTLDEYLTGEHDKMVKYVWRFISDDEVTFEVHDLPIGENNTKVMEFRMTRAK